MNRIIKDFAKFDEAVQEEIYSALSEGELQRATFPFRGELAEGVIFQDDETTYLIPTSTIKSRRAATSDDLDSDSDDSRDDDNIDDVDISDSDEIDDEE